jgi:hypothetical protein
MVRVVYNGMSGMAFDGYLYLVACKMAAPSSRTDVMIFFSPKISAKNWRFLIKTKLNYAKF